ncbi:MAG: HNH endonuclease [Gammaproteobacteria bacterium]|nr:HNH endonuclease [Gammaproteobacteria bacterium]
MSTAIATAHSQLHPKYIKGEQLGDQITELCGYIYAATYRLLVLIREFDDEGYWELPGLCSCAHWLNFKCGIGMNAAREKVRVAHALADLPKISRAFEKGELSYSKARAMTRIADRDNEDYLLMIARHGSAHHVEKLVSKYRRAKRLQETGSANEQYAGREFSYFYDDDGSLVINGRLPAEQGALLVKALEMAMDRQFHNDDVAAEISEPETLPARRADAVAEIAETYLNTAPSQASTADRYQVVVHVSAETTHIEEGPHVSAETSRRIACDCSMIKLIEDERGEPLSIGRRTRAIPPSIRRAMRFRDEGCSFPGCTNTHFVDGHHIQHWADGGETSLENLVQLCRHHHRLVHEGGFVCERTVAGRIEFRSPSGVELHRQRPLPGVAKYGNLLEWIRFENPDADIDEHTCMSKWRAGESIDWNMAVGALF